MKKCLYCGAKIADDSLFCTECGKEQNGIICPHCGTVVNEGDVFCTECGKRIDKVSSTTTPESIKPKCPHCGTVVNEGDMFCTECGKTINEKTNPQVVEQVKEERKITQVKLAVPPPPKKTCPHCGYMVEENEVLCDHCGRLLVEGVEEEIKKKTFKDYLPYIIAVVVVLTLIGGAWWYWDSSNQRVERERAIADSLEVVRQDSTEKANAKLEEERKLTEKEQHIEACIAWLDKFYKGLDKADYDGDYVRKYITHNAEQFLIQEYDYDECNNCLATWLFSYEVGDVGNIIEHRIDVIDDNTYEVTSIFDGGDGESGQYVYVVRLGIVTVGNNLLIDSIEKKFAGFTNLQ